MTTAGVLLAAGGGSRFGGPVHKLLAAYRGRPLVVAALDAALGAGLSELAVVVGAVDLRPLLPEGVTVLENPQWRDGLAGSLRVGIRWCAARGHCAAVVGLGDTPGISAGAWRAVAASPAPVAVASFRGRLAPPVRLAAEAWELLPTTGDAGARSLWHRAGTEEVPCEGDPADVDTGEDLARLEARPRGQEPPGGGRAARGLGRRDAADRPGEPLGR